MLLHTFVVSVPERRTDPRRRIRAAGAVAGALVATLMTTGAHAVEPHFHPTLDIHRTTGTIQIDGSLDDPGWRDAAVADGFVEVSPGDQTEPPVSSRALVTYDDVNLYVALIADDDPSTVRVSLRERDNIWTDDYFGIMLDTYGSLQWGYEIFVNPWGIQGDLRVLSDGNEDSGFDLIWQSQGKITDHGYQVELAIPFSSLRFEDRPEQRWRVNFWRDHQRDVRRRYSWAAQNRDDPCWMCQWGYLTGVRDISPSSNLELIASAIGYQAGSLLDAGDPAMRFENDKLDGSAGLSARYGITSSISAEATLNPDFSQIESTRRRSTSTAPLRSSTTSVGRSSRKGAISTTPGSTRSIRDRSTILRSPAS
ncbi:MAG: carbohydrate binding family 9 domain-containing protein [Candidatus Eisenbacteria bacterium]